MSFRDRIKELRRVPANQLKANPKNWREHPEPQREALQAMLDRVGIANAVVARELPDGSLELIDGHLRTEELGEQEVPILVLDVTPDEADQLLATLDPLAAMATPNVDALRALVDGLEFDPSVFKSLSEFSWNLPEVLSAGNCDEDEVPLPPDEATTQPGDLWILGEHRLLCGDSSKEEDLDRLLDGAVIDLVNTDPPYNVRLMYSVAA